MLNRSNWGFSGSFVIDTLLLYSIVIDFVNGGLQFFYDSHVPVGIAFRGVLLVIMLWQIIRKRLPRLPFCLGEGFFLFSLFYLLSSAYWETSVPAFNLGVELGEFLRIFYTGCVLIYFYTQSSRLSLDRLLRLAYVVYVVLGALNIACYIFDWGIPTYKYLNLGKKAFYADGNSFGLLMNILLPCALSYCGFARKRRVRLLVGILIGVIGTLLIASRVAIVGPLITISIATVALLFFNIPGFKLSIYHKFVLFLGLSLALGVGGSYALSNLSRLDQSLLDRFEEKSISSSRGILIEKGKSIYIGYSHLDILIGRGKTGGSAALGKEMGLYADSKGVEADYHDALLFFGWGLGGLFILIHVLLWWYLVSPLLYRVHWISLMTGMASSLWFLLSLLAGHGWGNTMLAPALGVLLIARNQKR